LFSLDQVRGGARGAGQHGVDEAVRVARRHHGTAPWTLTNTPTAEEDARALVLCGTRQEGRGEERRTRMQRRILCLHVALNP
jgi:hypothetical protein